MMNGWLSKDGYFTSCDPMQHEKTAREKFGLCEKEMYREGFIKIFSVFGYTDIIPDRFLTDAQKAWLDENENEIRRL